MRGSFLYSTGAGSTELAGNAKFCIRNRELSFRFNKMRICAKNEVFTKGKTENLITI